ncbi:PTS transporter subunit IIC, partial [Enterococcus faecium]
GIFIFAKLAEWMKKRDEKKNRSIKQDKKIEDIKLPGFLSIFNENMVATSLLMLFFFGIILIVLGKDYLIQAQFMQEGQ